jgi:hypothetical protein
VANLSAVEAWSFGASALVVLLDWSVCYVVILCLGGVGVDIVALVLPSVIGCSGAG